MTYRESDLRIHGRHCDASQPTLSAGFRFLDGSRGREANNLYVESRYLERRLLGS